jgi:ribonuclease P/MRP protein subunit POP7
MTSNKPFNVAEELAKLRHEKQNGQMQRLPPNATVQRRPIIHPAVASPLAGASVQKVVYVSSKTPFMSAVKRVKKFLGHVEKRATQSVNLVERGHGDGMRKLVEAGDKIAKDKEEVLVKASGKAITKALNVGEWFSNKEKDILCHVEVRSGSTSVVDDVVEVKFEFEDDGDDAEKDEEEPVEQSSTELEAGETTMELFGDKPKSQPNEASPTPSEPKSDKHPTASTQTEGMKKKRPRKKRKRQVCDPDDLPEQRLRWIKTVEVAISLKS